MTTEAQSFPVHGQAGTAAVVFRSRSTRYVSGVLGLAAAYYGSAKLGQTLRYTASVSAIWPPAAIAFTAHKAGPWVFVEISDDGHGLDPEAGHPGHFGLGSMRSRAGELGGLLTISSAPGRGTVVRVEAPAETQRELG